MLFLLNSQSHHIRIDSEINCSVLLQNIKVHDFWFLKVERCFKMIIYTADFFFGFSRSVDAGKFSVNIVN